MPDVQTNVDAKADDELVPATVVFWNNRFGFARTDRGGQVYIGAAELARAGIARLETGERIFFSRCAPRQTSASRGPPAFVLRERRRDQSIR